MLVEYLDSQSRWREGKAEDHPNDDLRNARSANALASLAMYVRDGKADAGVVARIETPSRENDTGVLMLGEQASREVSRYGFDTDEPQNERDEFLESLADQVEIEELNDWLGLVREGAYPLSDVPDR